MRKIYQVMCDEPGDDSTKDLWMDCTKEEYEKLKARSDPTFRFRVVYLSEDEEDE